MNTYLGIDLGTSGVKVLLVAFNGEILAEESRSYNVIYPHDGWTEQNPLDWEKSTYSAINAIFDNKKYSKDDVKGISFGGQMHGLVLLDKEDNVIRPAILWNDGRTQKQTDYLNNVIGKENLSKYTANIAFAGFTAPKILWVKENEPENFACISKIMLPKDYLAYKLTGVHSTDYSDASGMLLLDVQHKIWSEKMLEICSVKKEWLPMLYESYEPIGPLLPEFGFKNAIVSAGAGDNAAAAVGTGTVTNGDCNISLGTSGTVFISSDSFSVDSKNALHSFAHSTGKWHLMGCILSAASCNKWWIEDIIQSSDYAVQVKGMEQMLGENEVYFLPYLMGERSPHNDVNARGAFIGLSMTTTKEQMSLAVLEGVAFALRDCVEVAKQNGVTLKETNLCGGGAKSDLWKKIIANVLNLKVNILQTEQGPAYGGAILAMVGAGEYQSVEQATATIVKTKESVMPSQELVEKYESKYTKFKQLYPALKNLF